jgi:hypothetical protein
MLTKLEAWLVLFPTFLVLQTGPADAAKSFDEAKQIQSSHERELFQIAGVNGVGIGKDEQGNTVLNVYLLRGADASRVPAAIDGLPAVLIPSEEFKALDSCNPRPAPCAHRNTFGFPVPMGVSTSNHLTCSFNTGTLGFKVCDANDYSLVGYITNNHVAAAGPDRCPNGAPIGTEEFQAGADDTGGCGGGNVIGNLERYVTVGGGANVADVAFVRSDDGRVSSNIWDIGPPTGIPRFPNIGDQVRKAGSTTGYQVGNVQSVNFSGDINYNCFLAFFTGQIVITPGSFSAGGDSGSGIVDLFGNPVALLFAGNGSQTIANPIDEVLHRAGVRFNCAPPPPTRDVNIQASNGQFMSAEQGGGGDVNANRDGAGPWETFHMHDLDNADLMSGDRVTFQTIDGYHWLQAANGGGGRMLAIGLIEDGWETFVIDRIAGPGPIQSGDQVSLRTPGGPPWYATAEGGGGGTVNVNRVAVGPWETWTITLR